jgi:hypothetical protein
VLLGYAVADSFFIYADTYIGKPPLHLFIIGGIVMAVIAYLFLSRSKIPAYISISLALMNGIALAAALHPGLLRINQLTDDEGLRDFTYVRSGNNTYIPEQTGMPTLTMYEPMEYWARFERGSEYVFKLRKGALDFWQLDESSLVESYREFYLGGQ